MNRIMEFTPSSEEAVASRVLVLVHQAIDEHFPEAGHTNRQFTKTVFSEDSERTGGLGRGGDERRSTAFGSDEVTSPEGRPQSAGEVARQTADQVPVPPASRARKGDEPKQRDKAAPVSAPSRPTRLGTNMEALKPGGEPDWMTRITLALLLAGLMLLVYVLFA